MSFIKKHKFLSSILFLMPLLFLAVICILNSQDIISMTTSDWIMLFAGLFTYYGTVILAVVTVSQNDKLIEFQGRQEQRDINQQQITNRQLEISERQKEIADHQLQYIARQQDITETNLQEKYHPYFDVALSKIFDGVEKSIELEPQLFIRGYDQEFKAWADAEEGLNCFYVSFKNISKVDAYDVSIAEVEHKLWFDKDAEQGKDKKTRRNDFYNKLYINTYEHIPSGEGKWSPFVLSEQEEAIMVSFTMTYRNAYQHWFYQDVAICLVREENRIECQILINNSKQGEKQVEERGSVFFKNGQYFDFSS